MHKKSGTRIKSGGFGALCNDFIPCITPFMKFLDVESISLELLFEKDLQEISFKECNGNISWTV